VGVVVQRAGENRAGDRAFLGVSALLFAICTALTIEWCASMSAMGGMSMTGRWTMSMTWMRMPGQTWLAAAASFVTMWVVMMAAMMLPSLVVMQRRYRRAVVGVAGVGGVDRASLAVLSALIGAGYFAVWAAIGTAAFVLGAALAAALMERPALARVAPLASGLTLLLAGAYQSSTWKIHFPACCREAPGRNSGLPARAGSAWRQGVRFGLHCSGCCAGLTAALVTSGLMDLRAMTVVTAAIVAERFAPSGAGVARMTGVVIVAAGVVVIVRAVGAE